MEKARRVKQNDTRDGNLRVKGENFYRDAKKIKHLNMYKQGRAVRNAKGDIIKAADLQSTDAPVARVDPNRRWFGNTRVIAQDALTHFREAMGDKKDNSYQVLLKRNKLPMSLLNEKDTTESPTAKIVETESFASTFGPKQQRKKPRVAAASLEELMSAAETDSTTYNEKQELDATLGLMGGSILDKDDFTQEAKEAIFHKGQSKRIWNELYKVIDSSDVVIHVLDARDPLGTRCASVEKYIKEECSHKHLIYVLNKCDLVPTWVAVCTNQFFFFSFFFFFIFFLLSFPFHFHFSLFIVHVFYVFNFRIQKNQSQETQFCTKAFSQGGICIFQLNF
ncbi:GTPase required for pre-60S ribosomal subunit nuclear export and maturation [Lodderomyces elongisporus]|uniref:GTPase required for pre-60S ribosomal subunit nuclear export and maturation n=1 Tax=Lodderomyces elongisporus TaxID=36914 RepID=UPI00291DB513|nr:GTPase required for pre-60S ribosomal subunit nuclear export and maturation [Lodderomyces elongisporus]WLF81937.1 GTPase required for pre-60S ribosomal subunit nuclear export and maturation [Lodderomyces elongisporus]